MKSTNLKKQQSINIMDSNKFSLGALVYVYHEEIIYDGEYDYDDAEYVSLEQIIAKGDNCITTKNCRDNKLRENHNIDYIFKTLEEVQAFLSKEHRSYRLKHLVTYYNEITGDYEYDKPGKEIDTEWVVLSSWLK